MRFQVAIRIGSGSSANVPLLYSRHQMLVSSLTVVNMINCLQADLEFDTDYSL